MPASTPSRKYKLRDVANAANSPTQTSSKRHQVDATLAFASSLVKTPSELRQVTSIPDTEGSPTDTPSKRRQVEFAKDVNASPAETPSKKHTAAKDANSMNSLVRMPKLALKATALAAVEAVRGLCGQRTAYIAGRDGVA